MQFADKSLEYFSFFFVDIVGLSNPTLSTTTQTTKLKVFNDSISQCKTLKSTLRNEMLFLPTGDGMVIGFKNALKKPLNMAMELHEKLNDYNKDKSSAGKIFTRIGLHTGSIFVVSEVFGIPAGWGPGVILARRVMDIGDENHILMTSEMAESLFQLSDNYKKIIHPIHNYKIKHDQTILIYSVYGKNFGNPKRPVRGLQMEDKIEKLTQVMKNIISYNQVEFNLFLEDPQTNLLKCKKNYYFESISDEPIFEVITGINTSTEKSISELNVQAYDENDKALCISGINLDTPYRKEFSLKLNSPRYKSEKEKKYSIVYEVEEPNGIYENIFLIDAKNFSFTFNFPTFCKLTPKLYLNHNQKEEKLELKPEPHKIKGLRTKMRWTKTDGILEDSLVRLEW
ncbi:MAG: adenylate/guanylate cyclase domain-containing protein [Nitrosopumilaceae archaeon]